MGYLCSDFHIERNFFFSINKHESNYETITEWFFTLYTMSCLLNKKIHVCQRKYSNAAK